MPYLVSAPAALPLCHVQVTPAWCTIGTTGRHMFTDVVGIFLGIMAAFGTSNFTTGLP